MASVFSNIGSTIRNHLLLTLLVLELVLGIPAYLISTHTYLNHSTFLLSDQQTLTATLARGETITVGIQVENSLGGEWALPHGLSLQLDGLASPLTAIPPKSQDWNSTVYSFLGDETQTFIVSGNLTIPSSIGAPERRLLSGTISGTLIYPVKATCPLNSFGLPTTNPGSSCFQNQSTSIDIPVQLQLVSPSESLWSSGQLAVYIFTALEFLCALAVLLFSLLILFRALRTSIRRRSNDFNTRAGCFVLLSIPFAGFAAFICYTLLAPPIITPDATNTHVLPYPALITASGQPLALLVAFSVFFAIEALIIQFRN